jgi:hypothetical protein
VWKVGPDPKTNAIENASSLNVFAGANAVSVCELSVALDTSQEKVVELEEVLRTQRDDMNVEFKREASMLKGYTEKK